ncbi:MAG: ribonuclease D [Gemmatimonadales bacterium]
MTVRLIDSQAELEQLFRRFEGESLLAVDTEAASFHRFHDRIYLLQISSRRETAVVDPLAVTSLAPLAAALADPNVEIVFHDADYDLRLLNLEYGFGINNLFDTRIAAQLLNEPGVGLAALLEKYFGVKLDKRYQRADWSARPLSAEMLEYAAADTHHLPTLRDLLREQLRERGRLEWAEEEFGLATGARWSPPDVAEPAYLRLKGAKALPGRSLAVLRELFDWRDQLARRTDKAAFRILNNEPMLAMAQTPPADLAGLKAVRGIGGEQAERRGREILAAVQRGLLVPEGDLPSVERPPRRPSDPAYEARLERLKTARNLLASQYELAPGVLCPNGTLEAIARLNPATMDEVAKVPELRRWQLREIGGALLAVLSAPSHKSTGA